MKTDGVAARDPSCQKDPPPVPEVQWGVRFPDCSAERRLAGRLFRVNTLLSGSMPKLRDIPKLIRG